MHLKNQFRGFGPEWASVHLHGDVAGRGELHRVGQQIQEDSSRSGRTPSETRRKARFDKVGYGETLLTRLFGNLFNGAFQQLVEVELRSGNGDGFRPELRELQDVIEDLQQCPTTVEHGTGKLALLR